MFPRMAGYKRDWTCLHDNENPSPLQVRAPPPPLSLSLELGFFHVDEAFQVIAFDCINAGGGFRFEDYLVVVSDKK